MVFLVGPQEAETLLALINGAKRHTPRLSETCCLLDRLDEMGRVLWRAMHPKVRAPFNAEKFAAHAKANDDYWSLPENHPTGPVPPVVTDDGQPRAAASPDAGHTNFEREEGK